jgi:hypothetical protein
MKRVATILVGLFALVAVAGSASAALRVPQIAIGGGSLQGYLNSQGESINVLTDQNAVQRWQSTVSGNSTFTMQIELAGNAGSNTVGLYNASGPPAPALYQLLPGAATTGWFAVASFRSGPVRVIVNTFDDNGAPAGNNTFLGADKTDFGMYLQGPGGLFYSQDARNAGGDPQAVTFAGTGINSGSWWVAFEDLPFAGSDHDFDDAVLFCESINPTPVSKTSWGSLKARFH